MDYLVDAKKVIDDEIVGIIEVKNKLNDDFNKIVEMIYHSQGRVVMCGMGKSGHIAKKIFATLVSTGTPSMFMHPAEAFHGDLGMIKKEDIFFAISNSGETSEVSQLLPFIKMNGNKLIAMTGNLNSTIAKASDYHLDIGIEYEACPLNLAPTTSTTVSLILGDALAIALMKARNFKEENFAIYHPGGSLGRKLLSQVKEYVKDIVFVDKDTLFLDVISSISKSHTGLVVVGNKSDLQGIITDGDIRNKIEIINKEELFNIRASDLMTKNPHTISSLAKCTDADYKMQQVGINSLVVIDNDIILGLYTNFNKKVNK